MLEIENLEVSYSGKKVLKGISLYLDKGEIVALIGHNGAGKSTLLKAIMGILRTEKGKITFEGRQISNRQVRQNIKDGITLIPQAGNVFSNLTVIENLEMGGGILERYQVKSNFRKVFDLFPDLETRKNDRAVVLSGGQRRMLSIGMGLMSGPRVLLLDEPSGGLSPIFVDRVFDAIETINQEFQVSSLLVEQNVNRALDVSRRAYVMRNGCMVFQGQSSELKQDGKLTEVFLGN